MATYSEKLKDPTWKSKREIILKRDNYKCQRCHWDDPKDMQVHHIKYTGEPWEAPDIDLITLCDICHESIEIKIKDGFPMGLYDICVNRRPKKPAKFYNIVEYVEKFGQNNQTQNGRR